jgi:tetrahydromethanopterin S-methyltransferase subunit G
MSEQTRAADPTDRTLETVHREISIVEEKIELVIGSLEQNTAEKFRSVERQFELVERQRAEQKVDTKQAVDAALTAQKEAVKEQTTASERAIAKSETATAKQIDQMTITNATAINGVISTLNDIKERVTKVEAEKQGGGNAISSRRAETAQLIALFALVVTIGMSIFTIIHG